MKKRGFNPFGLPTLLSILILILVYSVVSVLLVDVRQTRNSILKSMNFISDTYNIETEAEQIIQEVNEYYQSDELFVVIDNLEMVSYDKDTETIIIELTNNHLNIEVLLSMDVTNKTLILESKRLSILNNQDYTQDGNPVYGGQ